MVTIEGSPSAATITGKTFTDLNLGRVDIVTGPFQGVLSDVLEQYAPADYFFNDGHHEEEAVYRYFEQALPYLSRQAIVVFDDINWSKSMKRSWRYIKKHQSVLDTVSLGTMGIALVEGGATQTT